MTASHKEEKHFIDLIEKNYVYGNTKREGKLVFLYIYIWVLLDLKNGVLSTVIVMEMTQPSSAKQCWRLPHTILITKVTRKGWVWKHTCLTVLL